MIDPPPPVVPFLGVDAGDPYKGEVWITGADTSMVHVTVIDSVNVEIDVWLNDAPTGKTILTTWDHMELCLSNPDVCNTM